MNRLTTFMTFAFVLMTPGVEAVAWAQSDQNPNQLQGLWTMELMLPGQPPAPLLVTYTSDGNSLVTGSQPGSQTQHGVWVRTANRQFAGLALFFLYDDKGKLTGMVRVRSSSNLADDLVHIAGTANADILDLAGNVVSTIDGITFKQTRVVFEPRK